MVLFSGFSKIEYVVLYSCMLINGPGIKSGLNQ